MYGVRQTHLTLEDYWKYLNIDECAGYGIRNRPQQWAVAQDACDKYWDQENRVFMSNAIAKAEERLEADRFLGYPLKRTYYNKQIPYRVPTTIGMWLRQVGTHTVTAVDTVNLSLTTDPVVFTVTVDFTDPDELVLRYPSSYYAHSCEAYTITPNCVTISGTTATVEVNRCRLLKPEYFSNYRNDTDRPDYTDDSYFLAQVEVERDYVDTTTGVNIVWINQTGLPCGCLGGGGCGSACYTYLGCSYVPSCGQGTQTACNTIADQKLGKVVVTPALYSSGSWTTKSFAYCTQPHHIEMQYMRGYYDRYDEMDSEITRAVIAIAHNNMPGNYCRCDIQKLYFDRDNEPLEPAVRLSLGRSTWGLYEAEQIIRDWKGREFGGYAGGLL